MTYPVDWVDNVPTDQEARTQDLHLRKGDVYFIIHHSVTTRVQDTIATFKSDREVSANFAIGPTVAGGDDIKVVLTVPESRRAWTSASPLDDRALTTEVCDKALGANYPISQNAKQILAQIAAYMHAEYGMPLDRVHILTHQEVYARGYGSYATACAGPDMQASMDWIVAQANSIINGINKEIDMANQRIVQEPSSGSLYFIDANTGAAKVSDYVDSKMDNATVVASLVNAFGAYETPPGGQWEFDVLRSLVERRATKVRSDLAAAIVAAQVKK